MMKEELIQKLPFREENLQKALLEDCKMQFFPAGTQILQEGIYVKLIPIVVEGIVKVTKQEEEREIMLYYLQAGESCIQSIFAGLNDERSRVQAHTVTDTELLLVPTRFLTEWQVSYPSFHRFIHEMYRKKFDDLLDAFNMLAFQQFDTRIWNYLKEKTTIAKQQDIKITHQQIAYELGTSREVVSRLLKKLENENKIKLFRGMIRVL